MALFACVLPDNDTTSEFIKAHRRDIDGSSSSRSGVGQRVRHKLSTVLYHRKTLEEGSSGRSSSTAQMYTQKLEKGTRRGKRRTFITGFGRPTE